MLVEHSGREDLITNMTESSKLLDSETKLEELGNFG